MRSEAPSASLAITLFGTFEVRVNGVPLPRLRTRKGQWLLALLALRAGREVDRAWLAGTLWPDSDQPQALASLRKSLADLRAALGPEAERLGSHAGHTLCLDLEGARVDVVAFDQAIGRGDPASMEEAVALYRGSLLEECAEEWVFQERSQREQAYLRALESLAAHVLVAGDPADAESYLRQAVATDPLRESAQRALMQALSAGGNYAAALLVYRELRLRLHQELHAEPDPETKAIFHQIRAEARRGAQAPRSERSSLLSSPPSSSAARPLLPEGTVTFVFTDIEGSTRLWEQYPEAMSAALARHDLLLRQAIDAHGGTVFKTVGDQFCAVFPTALEALAAAASAQRALQEEPWGGAPPRSGGPGPLRVRMALHTGAVEERDGDYFGPSLNRVARLLEAGHGGQILLSGVIQELVCEVLPEGASLRDLGEHRLRDLARPERVLQFVSSDLPADFPPLRSLDRFAHNLPAQLTSFIGRQQEVAQVNQLLATTRLLTLTGAGGCGKTRLALQVAADQVAEYAQGVWLVELAALSDPTLVPQTVAAALGVRDEPRPTFGVCPPLTATLSDHLRSRFLLLVLDNCEHLISACAELADFLLRSCPKLRILATSREGLAITGETTYRVPSLSLPDAKRLPSAEGLTEFEAPRLFVERARAAAPSFTLTAQNAPAVAQLCQRLDGIPLAIELAAARVKALPVETIAQRLGDRFRLLTGGSRTALPRQQTLRALIDWSYDLLTEPERMLLRRLSVFAGSWQLSAAEAVCAEEEIEDWEVLDLLTRLVEKSLVVYEERQPGAGDAEGARYRLLETVRQYGWERLRESGEGEKVRERHRDFFLRLAERGEREMRGSGQTAWLERVESEHDNLRAALAWSQTDPGGAEAGLRLAGALSFFWGVRGHWQEGARWLATQLTRPGADARSVVRARVLYGAGHLAFLREQIAASRALLEESLAISRELGDQPGIAAALGALGDLETDLGRRRALKEESLALFRELADGHGIAAALGDLGRAALHQGDSAGARALFEESLALCRELGDRLGVAGQLSGLARVARIQGDFQSARALWEESLGVFREMGDQTGILNTLRLLGQVTHHQGEYGTARALYEEMLAIGRELDARPYIEQALGELGLIAQEQGDHETARSLYGESLAISREAGSRWGLLTSLGGLGRVALQEGDYATARVLYEECLATARELGVQPGITDALDRLGLIAQEQGDYETARSLYDESLAISREVRDQGGIARTLTHLGLMARRQGDHRAARSLFEESLALRRELGNRNDVAGSLLDLGVLATTEGDFASARVRLEETLAIGQEQSSEGVIAMALEGFADLVAAQGQAERAARLFGAAERLRETAGPRWEGYRTDYQPSVAAARTQLDAEAFSAAWVEGRALTPRQAITEALADTPAP